MDLTTTQTVSAIIELVLIICVLSAAISLSAIRRQLKDIISLFAEKKK